MAGLSCLPTWPKVNGRFYRQCNNAQLIYIFFAFQPKQVLTNEVESYPSLFTVDLLASHRYKRSMCPKVRPSRTCQVVTIHWDALRAAKMRFLMVPTDEAILKKTSQEGLEMVLDQHLKGTTATITYKVNKHKLSIFIEDCRIAKLFRLQ